MRTVFRNAISNQTSDVQTRRARSLGSFLVDGVLRVKELSNGVGAAATVEWHNAFTGELVDSVTVGQNQGLSGNLVKVPYQYTLTISGLVNGAVISAGIDGDV